MARVKCHEGDWFAVPLRKGGFAVGVVARANRDGVLLGYFFGPARRDISSLNDVVGLEARGAVLVGKFGDLRLTQGRWPLLGRLDGWDRSEWPMPVFVRYEELSGRSFKVFYADDDANKLVREEQLAPGEAGQGPADGLMGAGFVEKTLTSRLS